MYRSSLSKATVSPPRNGKFSKISSFFSKFLPKSSSNVGGSNSSSVLSEASRHFLGKSSESFDRLGRRPDLAGEAAELLVRQRRVAQVGLDKKISGMFKEIEIAT